MTKIKEFTRPTLKSLRTNLESDLSNIGKKYGIKMEMGAFSFNLNKFTTKMTVSLTAKSSAIKNENKKNFMALMKSYFPMMNASKVYNGKFTYRGETFVVLDVKPSRSKYPFICERVKNGKKYKFPSDVIASEFEK